MGTVDTLLAGIVAEPLEETRWLVLADWLEENDDPRRAELLRLHRRLIATCCEPDRHPDRGAWQTRVVELLGAGVQPCVPRQTLELPGGVPLVGSFIPPGGFLMGGTEYDSEKPVHRVALTRGFFLGVHPATQAQWKAVMGTEPSHFRGPARPVENVSWNAATEFCGTLVAHRGGRGEVRLPTEAEWEWACRAGTTTHYYFGDVPGADLMNYDGSQTWNGSLQGKNRKKTTEVGSFPGNPWGLFDMHGNVWEWCQDVYRSYPGEDQTDPCANDKEYGDSWRILRGGAWNNIPQFCRVAARSGNAPAGRTCDFGFRVAFRLD